MSGNQTFYCFEKTTECVGFFFFNNLIATNVIACRRAGNRIN